MPSVVNSGLAAVASTRLAADTTGATWLYVWVTEDTASVQAWTVRYDDGTTEHDMTELSESTGTGQYCALWGLSLAGITSASGEVFSTGGSSGSSIAFAAVDTVDTGTPNDAPVLAELSTGTSATTGSVTSPTGDLVLGFISVNGNVSAAQCAVTGGTNIEGPLDIASGHTSALASQAGSGSVTMTWGTFGGNRRSTVIAINLNAAAAAGGSPSNMMLLGVGA